MHSAPYPSGTLPRGDVAAISAGVLRAKELVQTEDYRGYDPYDALCSPIFRSPGFRARLVRRAGQQVLKRSPLNVRPLLGIQKGRNPVTLALGLHAWSLLATVDASKRAWYVAECERLVQGAPRSPVARMEWSLLGIRLRLGEPGCDHLSISPPLRNR